MTTAAGALARGWGVDWLVPGDPARIRVLAAHLAQYAEVTADAAASLGRLDPEWTGQAYKAFWSRLTNHRQGFLDASSAFDAANNAIATYANELEAAKVDAGIASAWWQQGMDLARAHAMDEFLAGHTYTPPVAGDESLGLTLSLTGAGLRADAAAKLDHAWATVDGAARAAISALVDAQAKAPQALHWWDTAVPKINGVFGAGDNPVKREFAAGVVRGLIDMGTANSNRTIKATLDATLDRWEKSHGINPNGGIHGIGELVSGLLIPGLGAEGLAASLLVKSTNRVVSRLAQETATTLTTRAAAKTAEAAANAALAAGRTMGAAAELRVGGQVFTAVSTGGAPRILNSSVQAALEAVPLAQRAPWHGACAELGSLSQALDAGVNPAGGSIRAVAIGTSNPGHGLPKKICTSCTAVLDEFGVAR